MLIRLVVSGALALGLVATGSAATADSADARLFKGKTGQGYRIKLNVKGNKFKLLRFEADLKCRNGVRLTLIESGFLWTKTRKGGSFRDAQFGKTDSVYFRGRLSNKRLRGRVRLTDKIKKRGAKGRVGCKSRWIRFNAAPQRRKGNRR